MPLETCCMPSKMTITEHATWLFAMLQYIQLIRINTQPNRNKCVKLWYLNVNQHSYLEIKQFFEMKYQKLSKICQKLSPDHFWQAMKGKSSQVINNQFVKTVIFEQTYHHLKSQALASYIHKLQLISTAVFLNTNNMKGDLLLKDTQQCM